ncbi:MAG: tetratricopeptide repeat protein, partial [Deferribacteraceae bacterium]|nr:tetratricopeptide repeat protein [Deferribacteraceae bacterium]
MDKKTHALYLADLDYFQSKMDEQPNSTLSLPVASIYAMLGKYEEAVSVCHKGLTVNPGHTQLQVILADAMVHMGRKDEARELLFDVIALDEDNYKALKLLGKIFQLDDNKDGAAKYLRAAYLKAPEDDELLAALEDMGENINYVMQNVSGDVSNESFDEDMDNSDFNFNVNANISSAELVIAELFSEVSGVKGAGQKAQAADLPSDQVVHDKSEITDGADIISHADMESGDSPSSETGSSDISGSLPQIADEFKDEADLASEVSESFLSERESRFSSEQGENDADDVPEIFEEFLSEPETVSAEADAPELPPYILEPDMIYSDTNTVNNTDFDDVLDASVSDLITVLEETEKPLPPPPLFPSGPDADLPEYNDMTQPEEFVSNLKDAEPQFDAMEETDDVVVELANDDALFNIAGMNDDEEDGLIPEPVVPNAFVQNDYTEYSENNAVEVDIDGDFTPEPVVPEDFVQNVYKEAGMNMTPDD